MTFGCAFFIRVVVGFMGKITGSFRCGLLDKFWRTILDYFVVSSSLNETFSNYSHSRQRQSKWDNHIVILPVSMHVRERHDLLLADNRFVLRNSGIVQ